ncbi:tRNA1(Val) (adenine(37)-N6)-methyltransferase [Desulfococcaceae bacterium HSG7]|nr:tRNA1(Val) (adenine(37)-N6)-methyltransferase [Desulfococcaceae bacterium HSG7]
MATDTFFNGRLHIHQHPMGYRYSIDAVLLAAQVFPRLDDTILDLGTGCGIIALILAYRFPGVSIYGVEIQKELADFAIHNVITNKMANQISIVHQDMKALDTDSFHDKIDMVATNPPYYKVKTGRTNPDRQRAIARHEICITLKDIVLTARRLLSVKGKFVIIYPAERITALLTEMHNADIEPKKLRMVHSGWHTSAQLVIATGVKGGRPGLKVETPLVLYDQNNEYTEEVRKIFEP